MLIVSKHPETVEEVQAAIQHWLPAKDKKSDRWLSFSRIPRRTTLRVSIARSIPDVSVEASDRCLLLQTKNRQLNLNLDNFVVRAAFQDNCFCVDIDPDPAPEHHFLTAALRQFSHTKYPAFYTRVLRAVRSLEDDLPSALIDEATAAPTDHLVMLEAFSSAPRVAELAEDDPLVAAKLRGLYRRREMLEAAGGTLTSEQVAHILGLSRQAVDKRRSSNQLLALTQGRRGYSYPAFQFEESKTVPGLEDVLKALSALDPWMQLSFLTGRSERLGGNTPMEVLHQGKLNDVVKAASTYGEQGAL